MKKFEYSLNLLTHPMVRDGIKVIQRKKHFLNLQPTIKMDLELLLDDLYKIVYQCCREKKNGSVLVYLDEALDLQEKIISKLNVVLTKTTLKLLTETVKFSGNQKDGFSSFPKWETLPDKYETAFLLESSFRDRKEFMNNLSQLKNVTVDDLFKLIMTIQITFMAKRKQDEVEYIETPLYVRVGVK